MGGKHDSRRASNPKKFYLVTLFFCILILFLISKVNYLVALIIIIIIISIEITRNCFVTIISEFCFRLWLSFCSFILAVIGSDNIIYNAVFSQYLLFLPLSLQLHLYLLWLFWYSIIPFLIFICCITRWNLRIDLLEFVLILNLCTSSSKYFLHVLHFPLSLQHWIFYCYLYFSYLLSILGMSICTTKMDRTHLSPCFR